MARGAADVSYTIALLEAISPDATTAFQHEYNGKRLINTAIAVETSRRRRESTPGVEFRQASIRMSLREREKPFDPQKGFMFGSGTNDDNVDIMLHSVAGGGGVSRRHFAVNFDWADKSLTIQNFSRLGTHVESQTGEVLLWDTATAPLKSGDTIRAGYVIIKFIIPDRTGQQTAKFEEHVEEYRRECIAAMPRLEAIALSPLRTVTVMESEHLKIVKGIGRGMFAEVFKAVAISGAYFAVKVYHRSQNPDRQQINKEARLLAEVKHPNIIKSFSDKIVETADPYIVMEFIELGTLEDHDDLTVPQLDWTFRQICHASAYLHEKGIAHRDLKPANILMKSIFPVHIVIADFGLASQTALLTMCGTYRYAAPEVFLSYEREIYTPNVDVWSVGIILLQYSAASQPVIVPTPWQITNWLPILEDWRNGPVLAGREHFSRWSKTMVVHDAKVRPKMCNIVDIIDEHIKTLVQSWIAPHEAQDANLFISLTKLLDYLSLDSSIISRTLTKSLRNADAYKVDRQPRTARGRKRDVYVTLEHALQVVQEQVPPFARLIEDLVKEMPTKSDN